jgi:CheY-like chemotaxis protein
VAVPPASEPVLENKPHARSLRVLVVDDSADTVETLAMLLKVWGHAVQVAYDGPTAVQLARAQTPELVILDIGLPGMSGRDVARCLREELGLNESVLIAATGYGQDEDLRLSREAGFDHHLVKPVNPATLYAILERACAQV